MQEPPESQSGDRSARARSSGASRRGDDPESTGTDSRHAVRSAQREHVDHQVRRSYLLTVASTVLPGLGLVFTRRRLLGLVMVVVSVVLLIALGLVLLSGGFVSGVGRFLTSGGLLMLLIAFIVLGIAWVLGIMLTAHETERELWSPRALWVHRGVATLLCLAVAVPAAIGTQYVVLTKGAFGLMSLDRYTGRGGEARAPGEGADAWKNTPRINVLLAGSDAGTDRTGVRTDSLIMASIDTHTGDTTLVGIPRNLKNVPFPEDNPLHKVYPNGFDCSDCLMDAVWQEAEVKHRDLFPKDEKNPGLDTTREVVQEITGQQIDYSVVIDLSGFRQLVDAMGGVEINVPSRIPIGGKIVGGQIVPGSITGYIEPGYQRLDGHDALWYSRSRVASSDYDRMRRQRCMVNALVSQSNPFSLLQRFPAIMKVAEDNISFDIPQDRLPAFATLAQTMQKGNMRSVNLSPPTVISSDPDYAKIRKLVAKGIAQPHDSSAPKSKGTTKPKSTSTSSSSSTSTAQTGSSSSSTTSENPISDTRSNC